MPRGGYRPGSGRPRRRPIAERMLRIDVRPWRREGLLVEGTKGVVEWRRDSTEGGVLRQVGFTTGAGEVTFSVGTGTGSRSQRVRLATGGYRFGCVRQYWFVCPSCQRRIAILYVGADGLACRRCLGVAYASQSGSRLANACRRLRKVEARLGPGRARPAKMHSDTYRRLIGVATALDHMIGDRVIDVVLGIGGRGPDSGLDHVRATSGAR